MKNLRKLGVAVLLTCVLALSAFAGEIPTPPCVPGQIDTPPCAAVRSDMGTPAEASTAPGGMGGPTSASNETSFTEFAANVLLNVLPLF
jgi:hypothetical protein